MSQLVAQPHSSRWYLSFSLFRFLPVSPAISRSSMHLPDYAPGQSLRESAGQNIRRKKREYPFSDCN
jgi:hypothetical protein